MLYLLRQPPVSVICLVSKFINFYILVDSKVHTIYETINTAKEIVKKNFFNRINFRILCGRLNNQHPTRKKCPEPKDQTLNFSDLQTLNQLSQTTVNIICLCFVSKFIPYCNLADTNCGTIYETVNTASRILKKYFLSAVSTSEYSADCCRVLRPIVSRGT